MEQDQTHAWQVGIQLKREQTAAMQQCTYNKAEGTGALYAELTRMDIWQPASIEVGFTLTSCTTSALILAQREESTHADSNQPTCKVVAQTLESRSGGSLLSIGVQSS